MANIFTSQFSKAGHSAVCALVDGSEHRRCTVGELAEALQAASYDVSEETVRSALRQGCFDTKGRSFWDFKGRYGGIRECEEGEAAAQAAAEEQRQAAKESRTKRKAGAKTKAAPKATKAVAAPVEAQPSV